jgi:hypothetical protein
MRDFIIDFGGVRVKKFYMILMPIVIIMPSYLFAAFASPTPVPARKAGYDKTVKIAVVADVKTENGAIVPQVDKDISDLAVGFSYRYNKDRTRVVTIMTVPEANADKVRSLLKSRKKNIKKSDADAIESEFKGYKAAHAAN